MISRLAKNKKLIELMDQKKVDDSILTAIKENEKEYDGTKKRLKKLTEDFEKINYRIEAKKAEKSQTSIFSIKEQIAIIKEIKALKQERSDIEFEINALEEIGKQCEEDALKLKSEIEEQYTIYQENEMLIKIVEKIELKGIDLSTKFYKKYIKHVNSYMNSVYSLKNKTTLVAPDTADLAFLLSVLKKNEQIEIQKEERSEEMKSVDSKGQISKASSKKTTAPKKVVEELTSTKIKVLKDNEKENITKKTTRARTAKKGVVNQ